MKYFGIALVFALFMGGCTYKNETLNLAPYAPQYVGPKAQLSKTIYLRSVRDTRSDKSRIGSLVDDGRVVAPLMSNADFENSYRQGLLSALKSAGFNTDTSAKSANLVVEVFIKQIDIVHNDKNFDTNLQGLIDIEVIAKRGNETIKQNFKQKGSKWIKPSFDSKDLEPFLYELFADSIDQIAIRLTGL